MSWRIEESDALAVLRELPAGWAQCCVTSPPRDTPIPHLLAVLGEVHRVLRPDGTLWLALTPAEHTNKVIQALKDTAWLKQTIPAWPGGRIPRSLVLLTKQPEYLFNARAVSPPARCLRLLRAPRLGRGCAGWQSSRRAFCVPAPKAGGLLAVELIEWCILTSTAARTCGVCGTPWRRIPHNARARQHWRRECVHINASGRALVLDPFCGPGNTGVAAQRHGRGFLGIEQNHAAAALARKRLDTAAGETGR